MSNSKVTAYEGPENYIFISYAHKDTEKVFPIMENLRSRGYRIWYDDGIAPGSEWPEDIAQHLNGCAMVIAFVSPNSMTSVNCRREINFALSKQKPFLSVVLEPTEMPLGMELQLSAQQSVLRHNYRSDAKFIEKICACPDMACCRELPAHQEPLSVTASRGVLKEEEESQSKGSLLQSKSPVLQKEKTEEAKSPQKFSKTLAIVACVIILAVAALVIFFTSSKADQEDPSVGSITVYARVPDDWQNPHCWAWSASGDVFDEWPGGALTWDGSWYAIEVPDWTSGILINAGELQTNDIPVEAGFDVWVVVRGDFFNYFYEEPTEADIKAAFGS